MRRVLKITLLVAALTLALGIPAAMAQTDDDYTPPTVGGITATRTDTDTGTTTSGRLPFTGSDNTPSMVLIGLGAIAVGGIVVIATRRRSQVLARA